MFVSRYIFEFGSTSFGFPNEHLAFEDIDSRVESCARVNGVLEYNNLVAEVLLESLECTVDIGVFVVALIDEEHYRLLRIFSHAEVVLRTDLYSAVGGKGDDRRIAYVQCRYCTSAEVI